MPTWTHSTTGAVRTGGSSNAVRMARLLLADLVIQQSLLREKRDCIGCTASRIGIDQSEIDNHFGPLYKGLILNDNRLTHQVAKMIFRGLRKMRKMGIYPMDVRTRDYKAGLLVDLSIAITTPH